MSVTAGIVAEYNPFHNGHLHQLECIRQHCGDSAVVIAAMSGDFVQRGEPAVMSKHARAEAACRNGVNLVVELPLPWCMMSAEGFANAGVFILNSLGVSRLYFGAETPSCELLESAAELLIQQDTVNLIKEYLVSHPEQSFASARSAVLSELLASDVSFLEQPNNILALEYMKAVKRNGYLMECVPLERVGSDHDSASGTGNIRSASLIRSFLSSGEYAEFLPSDPLDVVSRELSRGHCPVTADSLESALLSRLRMLPPEAFLKLPDASGGAGERLYRAVRNSSSLKSLYENATTRRLPLSRIRRMTWFAALGIDDSFSCSAPPYARILAADDKGREYLNANRKRFLFPVLTKPADCSSLPYPAEEVFRIGAKARDFWSLGCSDESFRLPDNDWRSGPYMHKT